MQELLKVMRRLRAPDGCPWDREQTHESLRPYLIEEAAEAVDALHSGVTEAIVDELGDVLLQVAFHAEIGAEEGCFDYNTIEQAIVDKLVRRHPHVFGSAEVDSADEVVSNWEAIKRRENGEVDSESRVPRSLPALKRAAELSKALGWLEEGPPVDGGCEELESRPEQIGPMLLYLVQLAVRRGLDPELELRDTLACKLRAP